MQTCHLGMACAVRTYMGIKISAVGSADPQRPTLIVMVALPGAGKTTLAEELRITTYPNALILSSDDVRWTLSNGPGASYNSNAEQHVIGVIENYVKGCLAYGRDVIVDATNLRRSRRDEIRAWALASGARTTCYYIKCSLGESIRRSKHIPADDIRTLFSRFTPPTKDEGWTHLVEVETYR